MKLGLFKKSLACVLSVSFLLTLASCSLGSSSSDNGKGENIFKNKDIQAYAKRNAYTPTDYSEVELKEIDTKNEIIAERAFSYTLFKGVTDSNKYRLSIRYTNVSVNITVDSGETITKVTPADDWNNSFGYFIVNYSTGKKAVYDYKGIEVVTKREATEISVNHVTSNNQTVNTRRIFSSTTTKNGEITIYDFIKITNGDEITNQIHKIKATITNGYVSDFTREVSTSLDDLDYSIINNQELASTPLKNYDYYEINNSFYVKDLKGNVVTTVSMNATSYKHYVLDDKLFMQTTKTVNQNDDYTYFNNGNYYLLKTYSIDLTNGKICEVKNYDYYLSGTTNVYGYSESNDREYVAGIYASLNKIENKRLSLKTTTAMVDKNGNILSSKIGEKGSSLKYYSDKTYILYDGDFVSVLSNSGKVKATYNKESIHINFDRKYIVMLDEGEDCGFFLDEDLKIINDTTATPYTFEYAFNNGNLILSHDNNLYLANYNNGKLEVLDRFEDMVTNTFELIPDDDYDNYKTAVVDTNTLLFNNVYLVQYEVNDVYTLEIHYQDGRLLKKIDNVTDFDVFSNEMIIEVETADTTYYFGVSYIKKVSNN